jgi:hypothetical protein
MRYLRICLYYKRLLFLYYNPPNQKISPDEKEKIEIGEVRDSLIPPNTIDNPDESTDHIIKNKYIRGVIYAIFNMILSDILFQISEETNDANTIYNLTGYSRGLDTSIISDDADVKQAVNDAGTKSLLYLLTNKSLFGANDNIGDDARMKNGSIDPVQYNDLFAIIVFLIKIKKSNQEYFNQVIGILVKNLKGLNINYFGDYTKKFIEIVYIAIGQEKKKVNIFGFGGKKTARRRLRKNKSRKIKKSKSRKLKKK